MNEICITVNMNALQLTLIGLEKMKIQEEAKTIVSDHAVENVKDIDATIKQIRRKIEQINEPQKQPF